MNNESLDFNDFNVPTEQSTDIGDLFSSIKQSPSSEFELGDSNVTNVDNTGGLDFGGTGFEETQQVRDFGLDFTPDHSTNNYNSKPSQTVNSYPASEYPVSAALNKKVIAYIIVAIVALITLYIFYQVSTSNATPKTSIKEQIQSYSEDSTKSMNISTYTPVETTVKEQVQLLVNYEKIALQVGTDIVQYELKCESNLGNFVLIVTSDIYMTLEDKGIIPVDCTCYIDNDVYKTYTDFKLNPNYKQIMKQYLN